ncbi:restriction endonuclease subunit S [Halomonas marinisediminis]|uniref:restriction endonuclease subunit S n=1 Tax=Halomonas marinisediminis TaxID=2546095 RepID=UPI00197A98DF|nr:restriction endonuclease subunit S [Halomonas marinisediminis]
MTVLNDICELIVDCEHKTAPKSSTGYPSIRTPNVGRGRLILDNVNRVDEETYAQWTRRAVPQENDLIIAREAPVGNVAIIRQGEQVCLGQRTVLVRPDPNKVNPEFLCYFMLGDYVQGQFGAAATGATVPHLNMRDIRGLQVPALPAREVQNRIASILSAYDDLIENNTRRIEILEEMARRLYEEWFVHFRFPGHEEVSFKESELGKIPDGWEIANLEKTVDLTMGQSPKSEFYNDTGEGLPFHQGVTDFGSYFPSNRLYCTVENRIAEEGDILFSVRAPVGRINISKEKIVIGRGVSALRSKAGHQVFLLSQLRKIFEEEDSIGNGAIFKAVTKKDMQTIKLLQPDAHYIDSFESIAGSLWKQICSGIVNLAT